MAFEGRRLPFAREPLLASSERRAEITVRAYYTARGHNLKFYFLANKAQEAGSRRAIVKTTGYS